MSVGASRTRSSGRSFSVIIRGVASCIMMSMLNVSVLGATPSSLMSLNIFSPSAACATGRCQTSNGGHALRGGRPVAAPARGQGVLFWTHRQRAQKKEFFATAKNFLPDSGGVSLALATANKVLTVGNSFGPSADDPKKHFQGVVPARFCLRAARITSRTRCYGCASRQSQLWQAIGVDEC